MGPVSTRSVSLSFFLSVSLSVSAETEEKETKGKGAKKGQESHPPSSRSTKINSQSCQASKRNAIMRAVSRGVPEDVLLIYLFP